MTTAEKIDELIMALDEAMSECDMLQDDFDRTKDDLYDAAGRLTDISREEIGTIVDSFPSLDVEEAITDMNTLTEEYNGRFGDAVDALKALKKLSKNWKKLIKDSGSDCIDTTSYLFKSIDKATQSKKR